MFAVAGPYGIFELHLRLRGAAGTRRGAGRLALAARPPGQGDQRDLGSGRARSLPARARPPPDRTSRRHRWNPRAGISGSCSRPWTAGRARARRRRSNTRPRRPWSGPRPPARPWHIRRAAMRPTCRSPCEWDAPRHPRYRPCPSNSCFTPLATGRNRGQAGAIILIGSRAARRGGLQTGRPTDGEAYRRAGPTDGQVLQTGRSYRRGGPRTGRPQTAHRGPATTITKTGS